MDPILSIDISIILALLFLDAAERHKSLFLCAIGVAQVISATIKTVTYFFS